MRRVTWQLGGLFWRLTLSYILVTLIAAFTVLFVVTLAATVQDLQQANASPDQVLAKGIITHPETYLEQPLPNEEALRYWVAIPLFDALAKEQIKASLVIILDRHGQAASATACGTLQLLAKDTQQCLPTAISRARSILALPQARAIIATTLLNQREMAMSTHKLPTGETMLVQPVLGNSKQVIGALVAIVNGEVPMASQPENPLWLFLVAIWDHVPREGLFFILLAITCGTMTGLLISHDLARRLRQIMQTADTWSRGEFQTILKDPSPDEVGQLARNLNKMAEQLHLLRTSWQELAVVEERTRLARELHDSVKQHVFTNELLVRAARKVLLRDPQKAQQHLRDAEELSEQTQQELIEMIQALRPAALVDKGLAPAMQDYLVTWSQRTGIAFDLHIQKTLSMQPAIEATFFRIFQEALANVARHSKAQRTEVTLQCNDGFLSLTVRDNGTGFEKTQATAKGVGLKSMRERVEILAGELTLNSSPQGTVVSARMPFSLPQNDVEGTYCKIT